MISLYSYLLFNLSNIINLLIPLQGFSQLYRKREDSLLRGGFIYFNCFNTSVWLIYGFINNDNLYKNPFYVGLPAMMHILFLIMVGEYANIVYHNVIILNLCWYVRQQKSFFIYNTGNFTFFMFLIVPHLNVLYQLIKYKDEKCFNKIQFAGHLISAIAVLGNNYLEKNYFIVFLCLIKIIILCIDIKIWKKVNEMKETEEKMKKNK